MASNLLVGECTDAGHPDHIGRVRVRFSDTDGSERELWLPALQGLCPHLHDRVLVSQPSNHPEPVVLGVLDGFDRRPQPAPRAARVFELLPDESVTIVDHAGSPLLEVARGDAGPTLRVLTREMHVDVPGKLRLSAESLELSATAGEAQLLAAQDVVVRGEKIRLN